jgi:hypothetical protein
MLYFSVALFALSAILGVSILVKWLTKKTASRAVIWSHGIAAVVAFALLFYISLDQASSALNTSLILFGVAAIVGLYMFIRDLNGKYSPYAVAFIHALTAVAAFVALLLFTF